MAGNSHHLRATRWYDNKDVFALSTLYSSTLTAVRRQVDKEVKEVPCPEITADYNKFMGRVDLVDQMMCYVVLRWEEDDEVVEEGFLANV